jgi:hypothetical protein
MSFSDGTFCPWKGREHVKLMDIPTTFFRWALRERPEMVDRHPGLREYILTRTGAEGCVRSETRDARREGPPRGKTPRELGVKPARKPEAPPARPAAPAGDLFALAAAMREATK